MSDIEVNEMLTKQAKALLAPVPRYAVSLRLERTDDPKQVIWYNFTGNIKKQVLAEAQRQAEALGLTIVRTVAQGRFIDLYTY